MPVLGTQLSSPRTCTEEGTRRSQLGLGTAWAPGQDQPGVTPHDSEVVRQTAGSDYGIAFYRSALRDSHTELRREGRHSSAEGLCPVHPQRAHAFTPAASPRRPRRGPLQPPPPSPQKLARPGTSTHRGDRVQGSGDPGSSEWARRGLGSPATPG